MSIQNNNSPVNTDQPILTQLGLSDKEAEIYQIMLRHGKTPASKILPETSLKRTTVYSILEDLVKKGIVEKDESGAVIEFRAKHPYALKEYLESRVSQIKTAESKLDAVLPDFISFYNSAQNRPGVKFYEGKEGIIKIYEELLKQGKNIDSIEDKGEMAAFIPEYSKDYPKKRVKHNIFNRVIAPSDNPINPTNEKEMRETRFIPTSQFPFRMDVKIVGQLVSLITFKKDNPTGVLIDNQELAENFRMMFELIWNFLGAKKEEKIN
ncbi:MAG TPA: helix-turn-helix domain-containing protein [bacterium]|nr:helix-turn-helix domain-containing protein [bacterium]